jgi:ferredoxin
MEATAAHGVKDTGGQAMEETASDNYDSEDSRDTQYFEEDLQPAAAQAQPAEPDPADPAPAEQAPAEQATEDMCLRCGLEYWNESTGALHSCSGTCARQCHSGCMDLGTDHTVQWMCAWCNHAQQGHAQEAGQQAQPPGAESEPGPAHDPPTHAPTHGNPGQEEPTTPPTQSQVPSLGRMSTDGRLLTLTLRYRPTKLSFQVQVSHECTLAELSTIAANRVSKDLSPGQMVLLLEGESERTVYKGALCPAHWADACVPETTPVANVINIDTPTTFWIHAYYIPTKDEPAQPEPPIIATETFFEINMVYYDPSPTQCFPMRFGHNATIEELVKAAVHVGLKHNTSASKGTL